MSMLCLPQVAPLVSSGIERLETDTFKLHSLQTLTGAKFVITAQLDTSDLEHVLQGIYELYTDYVLKVRISTNPLRYVYSCLSLRCTIERCAHNALAYSMHICNMRFQVQTQTV
jgi:Sybindin-like family